MKQQEFYEYTGPEGFGYVPGSQYALNVLYRGWTERVIGALYGVPYKYKIVVTKPIAVAYPTFDDFYGAWQYKFMRVSNE